VKLVRLSLTLLGVMSLIACQSPQARHAHAEATWEGLETLCDLPCWHGLTPGDSTRQEVGATLGALDIAAGYQCFDVSEAEEEGQVGGLCTWESRAGQPIWGGAFYFARDGAEPLIRTTLYLRRPVSLEEGVAHFGEPGALWAAQVEPGGPSCRCRAAPPAQAEEDGLDFDLLYPERGLILSAFGEPPDQGPCLCRLAWIDAITLVGPGSADDLDSWWREAYGRGLAEEGGLFLGFPGWETPFR